MNKPHLVWRLLGRGLGWGVLIAVANGFALPVLLELYFLIGSILHSGRWSGPFGAIAPQLWFIYLMLGLGCALIPSVVGGGVLGLGIRFIMMSKPRLSRQGIWIGMVVGTVVAIGWVSTFFIVDWSWDIQRDWIFALLMWIWEAAVYAWLGRRLGLAYRPLEPSD